MDIFPQLYSNQCTFCTFQYNKPLSSLPQITTGKFNMILQDRPILLSLKSVALLPSLRSAVPVKFKWWQQKMTATKSTHRIPPKRIIINTALTQIHQCSINNCWYQKKPNLFSCIYIVYYNYCMGGHTTWENSIWSCNSCHHNCVPSNLDILILEFTDKNCKNCHMDSKPSLRCSSSGA